MNPHHPKIMKRFSMIKYKTQNKCFDFQFVSQANISFTMTTRNPISIKRSAIGRQSRLTVGQNGSRTGPFKHIGDDDYSLRCLRCHWAHYPSIPRDRNLMIMFECVLEDAKDNLRVASRGEVVSNPLPTVSSRAVEAP